MSKLEFDARLAANYAPGDALGDLPPQVLFQRTGLDVMVASPPGVSIRCELHSRTTSAIVIRTNPGRCHIAHVIAYASGPDDITTETIAIASALYWSWWRARQMHRAAGET
jgi:hypothetical protein